MANGANNQPTRRPSRLETELNEILAKSEQGQSNVVKFTSRAQRQRARTIQRYRRWRPTLQATGTNLLVVTTVLALAAFVIARSSPFVGRFVAYASIACFVYLLGRAWIRPHAAGDRRTKRWRGRDIEI
jgi:hypothetical protein